MDSSNPDYNALVEAINLLSHDICTTQAVEDAIILLKDFKCVATGMWEQEDYLTLLKGASPMNKLILVCKKLAEGTTDHKFLQAKLNLGMG